MSHTIRTSPQEIERVAAEWLVRRDAGLTPEEQQAFEAWLAADQRHLGAYARAEAVVAQLDRVGGGCKGATRSPFPPTPHDCRTKSGPGGSIAAGLTIASGGAIWLFQLLGRESYSTNLGETKEVVLSDGSMLTLNTDSKVLVNYSRPERRIVLVQGEALFDVAKNKQRPFIVEAGDTQVRAVGTSFMVKLLPQEPVQVLVREGVVEVKRPGVPEAAPVRVGANAVVVAPPKAPISTDILSPVQITRGLAWREGRIGFDNEPLADAAKEFARYSDIQILVAPDIANQTITGLFVFSDPVGFARAAALSLGLNVEVSNGQIQLRKPSVAR